MTETCCVLKGDGGSPTVAGGRSSVFAQQPSTAEHQSRGSSDAAQPHAERLLARDEITHASALCVDANTTGVEPSPFTHCAVSHSAGQDSQQQNADVAVSQDPAVLLKDEVMHGSAAEPSSHVLLLQQQLKQAQERCQHLEASINSLMTDKAAQQEQHERLQMSSNQEGQQQLLLQQQQLAEQHSLLETERSRADTLEEQLHKAQQQMQAQQLQLTQQQEQLRQSSMHTVELERQLRTLQQQLNETEGCKQQQLAEQQQALEETRQLLSSTQAQLTGTRTELVAKQQELLTSQQQVESSRQGMVDRNDVYQQLQQQQNKCRQLQLVSTLLPPSLPLPFALLCGRPPLLSCRWAT